jgi:hypothetical protein
MIGTAYQGVAGKIARIFMATYRTHRLRLPALLACLLSLSAHAADGDMTLLPTASTDGKTYAARFAAGLSLDNGQSFRTAASTGEEVLIRGNIDPDPAHLGQTGDLYVVEKVGVDFFMKNVEGAFIPWSGRFAELVPIHEDVTLGTSHTVDVFQGKIKIAAEHRIFLGYQPASGAGLIFTPVALRLDVSPDADALRVFEESIFDDIVLAKCTLCHVQGGVADGRTELKFLKDTNLSRQNFDIFNTFYSKQNNAYDYVLSKVSGGDRHVGGVQLAKGSAEYKAMENFLALLEGLPPVATTPSATGSFFNGISLQANLGTLRRAAILLAGRAPTAAEQSAVASGDDTTLRNTLRTLMEGENFHAFLKDAANDRLLVRGATNIIGACNTCFPNYSNRSYELETMAYLTGNPAPSQSYRSIITQDLTESSLELIAHVVENDLPYPEILTANYTMLTSLLNDALGGTASFSTDSVAAYQPGMVTGYYRKDQSVKTRRETRFNFDIIEDPGQLRTDYPHVGILNDLAFLARYPSTATNRNRARARWTFFHFLGVDIEQSAQRTTDPVALADTSNPTLKNPNCTVCHATMDPVAGAFQDYGDNGLYKENGMDALDHLYKFPDAGSTEYRPGDTWYRDMREPGFDQLLADPDDSLRWLAGQIVADSRFASAAVRFWWPAVIGRELLKRPEVATDVDYQARSLAFDAQEASIETLATRFAQSEMKIKSLLVELLMSEWFRAERFDPDKATPLQMQAHQIAGLGNEKLLTPEQLARKTRALTGFNWGGYREFYTGATSDALTSNYSQYYGGIDSRVSTRRTRDMTPLMSSVALTAALESSCPIVYGEFILDDAQRKLFGGISEMTTPLSEGGAAKIKIKLVELHQTLLGQTHATNSPEISASYNLLLETWLARQAADSPKHLFQPGLSCNLQSDMNFLDYLGYPGNSVVLDTDSQGNQSYAVADWSIVGPWLYPLGNDPVHMKQSWQVVLAYLLSHYNYLYE